MDEICDECGYDYARMTPSEAPSRLRREAVRLGDVVIESRTTAPTPAGSWTALEYAGHVRDVLLVARERTWGALLHDHYAVTPMGRDERVARGEYEDLTRARAAAEIVQAAQWLAGSWGRLTEEEWKRTLLYNYPASEERSLSWLAAHIVHEVIHHAGDIERLDETG